MVEAVGLVEPDLFTLPRGAPPPGNIFAGPEKFWLVVCTEAIWDERGSGNTTLTRSYKFVHSSEVSAEREASRLASKFKGYAFAVVESTALVYYHDKKRRLVWDECALEPRCRTPTVGEQRG